MRYRKSWRKMKMGRRRRGEKKAKKEGWRWGMAEWEGWEQPQR